MQTEMVGKAKLICFILILSRFIMDKDFDDCIVLPSFVVT